MANEHGVYSVESKTLCRIFGRMQKNSRSPAGYRAKGQCVDQLRNKTCLPTNTLFAVLLNMHLVSYSLRHASDALFLASIFIIFLANDIE